MPGTLPTSPTITSVLEEYRRALMEIYGSRLVRLVLFGSQARGEATADSDVDVLVVLEGPVDVGAEIQRTSLLNQHYCLEHDVLICPLFMSEERTHVRRSPLLMNIRKEGIEL